MNFGHDLILIFDGSARCGDFGMLMPFAFISGLLGTALLWLDGLAVYLLGRKAFYTFTHGSKTFYLAPIWFLACALTAGVGFVVRLYDPTMWAALIASVTWYTLLKQAFPSSEDEQPK